MFQVLYSYQAKILTNDEVSILLAIMHIDRNTTYKVIFEESDNIVSTLPHASLNDIRDPEFGVGASILKPPTRHELSGPPESAFLIFALMAIKLVMLWVHVVSAKFPRRVLYGSKYHWTRAFMPRVLIFMLQQYMHPGPFFLGRKRTKRKLLASGEYS